MFQNVTFLLVFVMLVYVVVCHFCAGLWFSPLVRWLLHFLTPAVFHCCVFELNVSKGLMSLNVPSFPFQTACHNTAVQSMICDTIK